MQEVNRQKSYHATILNENAEKVAICEVRTMNLHFNQKKYACSVINYETHVFVLYGVF